MDKSLKSLARVGRKWRHTVPPIPPCEHSPLARLLEQAESAVLGRSDQEARHAID